MKKYADIKLKDNAESFIVVLWKWYKKKFEEENPETGETKEVYKQVPSIRYYKVYRASDVINLPKKELTPEEVLTVEDADNFIEALDIDLRIMKGSDRAYYSPNFDFISVPAREQFLNSYEWYSTTFHEIGHWTGHESRLKRSIKNSFGDQAYSREELCAEMTSGILTSYFNIVDEEMEKNNIAYLTGWLDNIRKGELNYIVWASQKAHEAAEYLLSQTGLLDVSEETQKAS